MGVKDERGDRKMSDSCKMSEKSDFGTERHTKEEEKEGNVKIPRRRRKDQ